MGIIIGGSLVVVSILLLAAVTWWRIAGDIKPQRTPRPMTSPDPFPIQAPSLSPTDTADNSVASPLPDNAKIVSKHALRIERKGDRTQFWFDGVPYDNVDDIPDAAVREQARQILPQINQAQGALAQTISKTRITVNGVTYNSLAEIADPHIRQAVQDALKKA